MSYFSNFALTMKDDMLFRLCVKNDRVITIPSINARNRFSGSSLNVKKSKKATATGQGKRKFKSSSSGVKSERFFSVPVQKVRDKCDAFFTLRASRAFCAFYSISFPGGISDEVAFRLWNVWLTRVRKYKAKFEYLWVTERQGNGTVHYHLITNSFLNIRVVNHYMAAAIGTAVARGECSWGDSSKELYNGVDVQRVHNAKGVSRYLTKYLTKKKKDKDGNVIEVDNRFKHLAWHCSRRVSALFTTQIVNGDYLTNFFGCEWFGEGGWQSNYNPYSRFHCNVFYFVKSPPNWVMKALRSVNERIWSDFFNVDFLNNLISYNYGNEFESACVAISEWSYESERLGKIKSVKSVIGQPAIVPRCQVELQFAECGVA